MDSFIHLIENFPFSLHLLDSLKGVYKYRSITTLILVFGLQHNVPGSEL